MDRREVLRTISALSISVPTAASAVIISAHRESLVIGLTAVILADQAAFLTRWSDYLSARLGLRVSFVAQESYQGILDMLFGYRIDAAWICGYPFVRHQARLRLLAVPVYESQPLYRSYLIRSRASGSRIDGWHDLKGKVLAYSDPLSNGWSPKASSMRAALPTKISDGASLLMGIATSRKPSPHHSLTPDVSTGTFGRRCAARIWRQSIEPR